MELKKNPNLELSKYSTLFFNVGLALAIGFVVAVFEWETVENTSRVNLDTSEVMFNEIIEDVPLTNQAPPPPPKIRQPQIIEVKDEVEIEEDIEIDLDIDMVEESIIEDIVFETAPDEEISDEVFSVVEVMPSFPGGTTKFYDFISKNLKYPRKALKANVEGKVIVRFIVAENGDVSEVEVLKGIGYDCDEEAIRVLLSSPDWIPGRQQGRNVKVRIMVPLTFDI
jgi:protein TonB